MQTEENGETPISEVELIEKPEQEPKSMDDTIRETLHALHEKGIETDKEPESPEAPEEKAQRIRDEKGKFAAKEVVEPAPVAPAEIPPDVQKLGFRKEESDAFIAAPAILKDAIVRRITEMHQGIEQYKTAANYAQTMDKAIAPFAATLQSLNITPDKAVSELMAADHRLRYGSPQEKSAYLAQLAQSYGIDLTTIPEQQEIDPNVSALQQRLQQLEGQIQQQTLMGQKQEEATLNSAIAAFRADPNHSHFDSVKGHMSALLQAGQAKDLADAYEQAVYANPTTRVEMIAQQQAALKLEATQKAQAAKDAASANIKRRPSMPVSQPIGTMDETIRSTLRRLQGS